MLRDAAHFAGGALELGPEFTAPRRLLDRSPVILPIPGTSNVEHLEANMLALA